MKPPLGYIDGYIHKEARGGNIFRLFSKIFTGGKGAPKPPANELPKIPMRGRVPKVRRPSILTNKNTWNIALPAVGGTVGGIRGYNESEGDSLAAGLSALGGATTLSPTYWKSLAKGKILGDPTISLGTGLISSAATLSAPNWVPKTKERISDIDRAISSLSRSIETAEGSVGNIGQLTADLQRDLPRIIETLPLLTDAATKASKQGTEVSKAIAGIAEKGIPITGIEESVSNAVDRLSEKGIPITGIEESVSNAVADIKSSMDPTASSIKQVAGHSEKLIKKLDTLIDQAKAGKEEAKSKLPYYAALAVVLGGGAYGIHQFIQYRREKKVAEEAANALKDEKTSEEETEEAADASKDEKTSEEETKEPQV